MTHPTWLDQALDIILTDEGGYAERPEEGGGAVNFGVTLRTYALWRAGNHQRPPTKDDLRAMTEDEAREIYTAKYATPVHFDAFQPGIGYLLLDSAVNNGLTGCQRLIETATGHEADGQFDPMVFWAVRHRDRAEFINAFCDARNTAIAGYKHADEPITPGKPRTWGDAWRERNERVRGVALDLAGD